MIYKFTDTDFNYTNSPVHEVYNYYKNGGEYNEVMKEKHCMGGYSPTTDQLIKGQVRLMGWLFDFTRIFNKYLVKLKYHGWTECYAPSKMFIRDYYGGHKIADKIILLVKGGCLYD